MGGVQVPIYDDTVVAAADDITCYSQYDEKTSEVDWKDEYDDVNDVADKASLPGIEPPPFAFPAQDVALSTHM